MNVKVDKIKKQLFGYFGKNIDKVLERALLIAEVRKGNGLFSDEESGVLGFTEDYSHIGYYINDKEYGQRVIYVSESAEDFLSQTEHFIGLRNEQLASGLLYWEEGSVGTVLSVTGLKAYLKKRITHPLTFNREHLPLKDAHRIVYDHDKERAGQVAKLYAKQQ